jgi:hypothetical protein
MSKLGKYLIASHSVTCSGKYTPKKSIITRIITSIKKRFQFNKCI